MKNMITALFGKIEYHEHIHYHYYGNHSIPEDHTDKPKNEIETDDKSKQSDKQIAE